MMHFGFWPYGLQSSAAIEEIINKNGTLEELLDEDGLQTEVKTNNQKLIDYLIHEENFTKLIQYATTEPTFDEVYDKKRCYKYPFVAADILSQDNQKLIRNFIQIIKENTSTKDDTQEYEGGDNTGDANVDQKTEEKYDDKYLNLLFDLLEKSNESTFNLTLAGYFTKIANAIYSKATSELLLYLYERKPSALFSIVKLITSKSLSEFLVKILTFENSVFNEEHAIYLEKRLEILDSLINKLSPGDDLEEIQNAGFVICEVIAKYGSMNGSQEIIDYLLDKQIIDKLFELLQSKFNETISSVIKIINYFVSHCILKDKTDDKTNLNGSSTNIQPANNTLYLINHLSNHIALMAKFCSQTEGEEISSTYGKVIVPLGIARMKMVELMGLILKIDNHVLYSKIIQSGIIKIFMDLFIKYEWNNMLHIQVEKILLQILQGNSLELKKYVLETLNLSQFIIEATENLKFNTKKGTMRKGYLGYVFRLANKLAESKDQVIVEHITNSNAWKDFIDSKLTETNNLYKTQLGGHDPRAKSNDCDDSNDNSDDIHRMLFQKFSKFFSNSWNKNTSNDDTSQDDKKQDNDKQDEDKKEEGDEDDDDSPNEDENHETQNEEMNFLDKENDEKHVLRFGANKHDEDEEKKEEEEQEEDEDFSKVNDDAEVNMTEEKTSYDQKVYQKENTENQMEEETNENSNPIFKIKDKNQDTTIEYREEKNYDDSNYWKVQNWHNPDEVLNEIL